MTTSPLAQQLAARVQGLRIDNFPAHALAMATAAITDTIGCMLAGASQPATTLLRDVACTGGPQHAATLVGMSGRSGILDAALVNGTAAHAIDFDDMAAAMGGHPSAPVVPVAFALGEQLGSSGQDVLEAYIIGVEVECRLGRVVHPHHYVGGWHPTSSLGVFGACAAAARLLRLDVDQTATAFGLSASLASGIKANFGTMTKPLHVGHAARNGLMAALLVSKGYTANSVALEHKEGFFAAFDGLANVHQERLFDHWGETLEIDQADVGLKQFACCGSTHNAIMSMLAIRQEREIDPAAVESIEITAHARRLPHTDNPFPKTPLQSKFSIQYATVRALLDGPPRIAHFEGDSYSQLQVQELLARTRATAYAEVSEEPADQMKTEVVVRMRDGSQRHGQAHALGRGPSNPMTEAEMWQKFGDCATGVLPGLQARKAFDSLSHLADVDTIRSVTRLLSIASS